MSMYDRRRDLFRKYPLRNVELPIITPTHFIREVSFRELSNGHVAIVSADYSASDEEVLDFVSEKHPRLLGWVIYEYYRDDKLYYWMVTR